MLRAVLDANVYISATIQPAGTPGRLVERFLRDADFEIVLSLAIVDEVMRALAYPKVRKLLRGVDAQLWFEDIVMLADLVVGAQQLLASATIPTTISTSPQLSRDALVTLSLAIKRSLQSRSTPVWPL